MKHIPLLALCLALGACASAQPRPVATQYSRENSSRVFSRGPAPMDDTESDKLVSGGTQTSTPARKKTAVSGNRTSTEETVITSTSTETVLGTNPVAAPDTDIKPQ